MAIKGWVPAVGPLTEFQREVDRLFGRLFGNHLGAPGRMRSGYVYPPVNVRETAEQYVVECELPGLDMEELEVIVSGDQVAVAGERPDRLPAEGATLHRRERDTGRFNRALALPGPIQPDRCEARLRDGVLTIRVPKAEEAKPKKIPVHTQPEATPEKEG